MGWQDAPAVDKSATGAAWQNAPAVGEKKQRPFGEKVIDVLSPAVEGGAAIAGGIAGSPVAPPFGALAGAGLGYGMAKEAEHGLKMWFGYEEPRKGVEIVKKPAEEVGAGAAMEAGGQVIGKTLPYTLKTIGKMFPSAKTKAAKIAASALGENLPEARKVLQSASGDMSAAQALAKMDAPTAQALLQRAQAHDPEFFVKMFGRQEAVRLAYLQEVAQGANQTTARAAREELKKQLNERLIPVLKTELEAANIAGRKLPEYEAQAARMGEAASQKVEDVRRFTAAGERASGRYSYMGELAGKAEEVAAQSAEGSLQFGNARRFAEYAGRSLEAHGLRPLRADAVIASIGRGLSNPEIAGNEVVEKSLLRVGQDIAKWTNNGGVVDAFALDSIRKNSVNSVIEQLMGAADPVVKKRTAALVIAQTRPIIIDAIEGAGGTGYRQYLQDYAAGEQVIAQTKMGGKLLDLYQTNPKQFVRVVEGNSPQDVEKIFGPGSYSIFKEMSAHVQQRLAIIGKELTRDELIRDQAKAGTTRLADVLKTELGVKKIPPMFSRKVTIINDVIDTLESRVSKKTMAELTKAAKSAKNLNELLDALPPPSRLEAESVLKSTQYAAEVGAADEIDRKKGH